MSMVFVIFGINNPNSLGVPSDASEREVSRKRFFFPFFNKNLTISSIPLSFPSFDNFRVITVYELRFLGEKNFFWLFQW